MLICRINSTKISEGQGAHWWGLPWVSLTLLEKNQHYVCHLLVPKQFRCYMPQLVPYYFILNYLTFFFFFLTHLTVLFFLLSMPALKFSEGVLSPFKSWFYSAFFWCFLRHSLWAVLLCTENPIHDGYSKLWLEAADRRSGCRTKKVKRKKQWRGREYISSDQASWCGSLGELENVTYAPPMQFG